jgi:hypothetical protein
MDQDYADDSEEDTSPTDIQKVASWPEEESGEEEVFDHVVIEEPKAKAV